MTPTAAKSVKRLLFLLLLFNVTLLRAQVPVASFTTSSDSGCAPLLVHFTNTSSGATGYLWYLGNGNNSTLPNPSASYTTPGNYTVSLVVTSATGQKDSTSSVITIVNNPVVNFSANIVSACEDDQLITFTNLTVGANTYIWDFGDGNSSTLLNPTHLYTSPGTYNVKLVAMSNFGCQGIATKNAYITILAKPTAQISVSQSSSCDISTIFQFTSPATNISTWSWNFGDGSSSALQNPSHQYSVPGTYPVTLIVTSSNGCSDTATAANNISIGNSLIPSFTMDDSAGCGPLTIQFDCTVPDAITWNWDFGDGSTSTADNPSHTYTNPGSYNITLAVTTLSGCNGSVTYPALVTVDSPPVANFTVAQDSGCVPYTAQFVNLSTGAATYNWQFGNNDSSTLQNPTTVYTIGGFFSVTLIATSPNGCQTAITKNQLVKIFAPTAKFTATPVIGCPGMNVQFTHTGNNLNVVSYFWNFGDGTTSTLQNPSHVYNTLGYFNVWMAVRNSFGCVDTFYRANYIRVVPGQVPYTVPDTLLVCQGNPIAFTDPTIGSNTWNWNFGNGSGSTSQSPSATYLVPGIYTVTLQTSMAGGCSQTFNPYAIVNVIPYIEKPITVNYINRCKPYTVSFATATQNVTSYAWTFGDGGTSTLPNPTHIYTAAGTYTITCTMTVGAGCIAQISKTITLGHTNPIQASVYDVCIGAPVQFTLNDTAAFSVTHWDFDDGSSSSIKQPSHAYLTAGNYDVVLITTDTLGCVDTFTIALPVVVNNPIPDFSAPQHVCIGTDFTFTNLSQNASSYLWDFGDSTTSTDVNPQHQYTTAGTYTITLTATQNSCSFTKTQVAYITVIEPVSQFTFTTNGQCMPVTVHFTDQSPGAVAWIWSFGNGDSSTVQHPVYSYYTDPTDSIRLTATDAYGCSATSALAPFPYYAAGASVSDSTLCLSDTAYFTDISNGAIGWNWDFGNGQTSTLQNPYSVYPNNGNYTVTLIATFPGGCHDTIVYPDMVITSSPHADFISPSVAGCSPTQISFTNNTSDATMFSWDFGDGGISSNINPQHIYYIPGTYNVTLIAINSFGCRDTVVKSNYITIPGTYTNFGISTLSGCRGQSVQFSDSSVNASTWSWDFGDGTISSTQSPGHIYADTGSYTVTLITQDSIGCTSSFTYPNPIVIHPTPVADAYVTDSSGCSDFSTNFINLSTGAVSYEWNFGDGDTSTTTQPAHTFLQGGQFYPQLVAISSFGCSDTFNFNTAIDVLQSPAAQINAASLTGCEPAGIQFTNGSTLEQNPSYQWTTSDGQTGTGGIFNPVFATAALYDVSLVTTNANGCYDSTSVQITVNPTPVASATVDLTTGCNPLQVQFTNSTTGGNTYDWSFGNGTSATSSDPAVQYPDSGYFIPQLIATNSFGCADTFTFNPGITVLQTPLAQFTIADSTICYNLPVTLINSSTGLDNPVYNWDLGFTMSALSDPVIACGTSGTFDINLIVTNANGCADTLLQPAILTVSDTLPPNRDPIASVSVTGDQTVDITWFNSSAADLSQYRIYRYNNSSAVWDLIYTDTQPVSAASAVTSVYTDTALDTKNNSYSYRIQTVDECGYAYPLDSLTAHTTINVSTARTGLIIDVSWTPYAGCNFNEYRIFRRELPSGSSVMIGTVPSSTLQFRDTTILCPYQYEYRIQTDDLCGLPYQSWSDTSSIWPENIFEGQHSDLIKTTVVNNEYTLTEWLPPVVQPMRVASYEIYRSLDKVNFSKIASVPAGITTYSDYDVDVKQFSYTYKVFVINDCSQVGPESGIGKSILLEGYWKDYRTYLQWSRYEDWDTGVERYRIEFLSPQGTWVPVIEVDGGTFSTEIDD